MSPLVGGQVPSLVSLLVGGEVPSLVSPLVSGEVLVACATSCTWEQQMRTRGS